MTTLITYSDHTCSQSASVCIEAAKQHGCDKTTWYTPVDISEEFRKNNSVVWGQERGASYWIWKSYIVNKAIQDCNDGDILIYCDAGVKLINNVSHIIDVMDQDMFLFSNGHQHCHWCKSDVVSAINGDEFIEHVRTGGIMWEEWPDNYVQHQQVQASLIFIGVNNFTRNIIKEWLLWCQMPGFIDDSPSKLPNHPEFAQHRYDQAVLTCLAIKYSIKLHWWPDKLWYESQRYRWPEDKYPSMVLHHRKRNAGTVTNPEGPTW